VRAFALAGLVLLLLHAFVDLTWSGRHLVNRTWLPFLSVTSETSVWTWLSVSVAWLVGLAGCTLGRLQRARGSMLVGALFLYLSLDDACQLHERAESLVDPLVQNESVFAWVLVFGPLFGLLGVVAVLALARELRGNRRALFGVLAGFGCLGLALGLELVERPLFLSGMTWRGFPLQRYTILLEEALELAGPLLVLAVLGSRLEAALAARSEPVAEASRRAA